MRPKLFDEEAVLKVAFAMFREKGVRGTSLTDIARATNLNRGSLYNAFGNKEALFLSAYAPYVDHFIAAVEKAASHGSFRERLLGFFEISIKESSSPDPAVSSPTTRGLMELSTDGDGLGDDARAVFVGGFDRLIQILQGIFEDAQRTGAFAGDPREAAEYMVMVAQGLVVMERAYGDHDQLRRMAAAAVDMMLG